MRNRYLVVAAAVLVIATVLIVAYVGLNSGESPLGTPIPLLDGHVSSLGGEDLTVSQGSALQLNVTLTSRTEQKLTIAPQNLTLNGVSNSSDYPSWDTSIPQSEVLSYAFDAEQLVLQPYESNSTVLTISIAEDAPLGQYALSIDLKNVQGTQQVGGIGLTITVTQKKSAVTLQHESTYSLPITFVTSGCYQLNYLSKN
jgi:hypothetical protein